MELLDGASYNSDDDGSRTTTTSTLFAVLPCAWEGKLRWENHFRWGKKIRPKRSGSDQADDGEHAGGPTTASHRLNGAAPILGQHGILEAATIQGTKPSGTG